MIIVVDSIIRNTQVLKTALKMLCEKHLICDQPYQRGELVIIIAVVNFARILKVYFKDVLFIKINFYQSVDQKFGYCVTNLQHEQVFGVLVQLSQQSRIASLRCRW